MYKANHACVPYILIEVVYMCIYWVDTMELKNRIVGICGRYVVPLIPD
jgi:hypothetical protein